MIKFLTLILILLPIISWGQAGQPTPVIYLNSNGTYIHPNPVVFAQAFDSYLQARVQNNQLTVTNPQNVNYGILQVIQSDGRQLTLVFRSSDPEQVERDKRISLSSNDIARKRTFLNYTKRWTQRNIHGSNRANLFTSDLNRLAFRTNITNNLKFGAAFSDTTTESANYQRYSSRYLFTLNYKKYYINHGTIPLVQRSLIGINQSGAVLGTRVGYNDNTYMLDLVTGKANLGNNEFGNNVYGASTIFNLFDKNFGLYFYENPEAKIRTPTIDWNIPLFKHWSFSGAFTQNQTPTMNANISNLLLQYYKDISGFGINSFSFSHYYRPDGQANLLFGEVSTQQFERIFSRVGVQIFKNDNKDALNLVSGFSRNIGEYNLEDMYTLGLLYRYSRLEAGLNYNIGFLKDTFNETDTKYSQINPYLSWNYQHINNRTSSVAVSSFFSQNQEIRSNSYFITYQNSSTFNSHIFRFSRNSFDENNPLLDTPNINAYSLGYSFSSRITDTIRGSTGINTRFSNTKHQDRENYYLDLYSVFLGASYRINDQHSLSVRLTRSVNLRPITSTITSDGVGLNYDFRYGTDSLNPLNYIVNHKNVKAHFYYDNNINGKKDADENLIEQMNVDLFAGSKLVESKKTDNDGYVRFSGLEASSYDLAIPSSFGSILAGNQRSLNLEDGSKTLEIGVAKIRNVSIKIYDETTKSFIRSSMSFILNCPAISYEVTQTLSLSQSSVFILPAQGDCFISPIPLNYVNHFESIDFERKKVVNNEIVFKIKQKRVLDIISNVPISVTVDGRTSTVHDFKSFDIEKLEYSFSKIFSGKSGYSCSVSEQTLLFHPEFFERKQMVITCIKK